MMSAKIIEIVDLDEYTFEVYDSRPDFKFKELDQIHSSIVVLDDTSTSKETQADGFVSIDLKEPLAIRTADCLPVVFIGKLGCALIHAGWRGLEANILKSKLIEKVSPFKAYIGPHISVEKYEVSSDFKEYFASNHLHQIGDSCHLDMKLIAFDQIRQTYSDIDVTISSNCTFTNTQFHSYRRNKTNQRNWNILRRK